MCKSVGYKKRSLETTISKKRLYDKLYTKIDRFQKKYNICDVKFIDNKFTCRRDKNLPYNGCCIGCKNLKNCTCQAKSLLCKMWICRAIIEDEELQNRAKPYFRFLEKANRIIFFYDIPIGFRMGKKASFGKDSNDFVRTKDWYKNNIVLLTEIENEKK
jgi:hypothetical protein